MIAGSAKRSKKLAWPIMYVWTNMVSPTDSDLKCQDSSETSLTLELTLILSLNDLFWGGGAVAGRK
jgi:hypothetical protein